ncbi:MAG: hypothetical protein NVS2B6_09050 [Thermoleophilaceae bacterium]
MRRLPIAVGGLALLLLVVTQALLPRYLERRIERRLSAGGGSAHVQLSAFPALRLLSGSGDRLRVSGSGLSLSLAGSTGPVLTSLDSFDRVDIRVTRSRVGPFALTVAELERSAAHGTYRLRLSASASAGDVAAYVGGRVGGGLGSLLGAFAGGGLPFAAAQVPINVDAAVQSRDGQASLVSVDGTVAGFPAAPLVEALVAALAGRI